MANKNKETGFKFTLSDAEKRLKDAVNREDWSDANIKQGYLDGITERKNTPEHELFIVKNHVENVLESSILAKDYGKCAFLRAYLSGWGVADTVLRIEELTSKNVI